MKDFMSCFERKTCDERQYLDYNYDYPIDVVYVIKEVDIV